jgi:hypothetical protein
MSKTLLPLNSTPEQVMQAVTQLPPRLINRISDVVSEENGIRPLSKLKHLAFLEKQKPDEVLKAYNLVVQFSNVRTEKIKAAFKIIITFGLSVDWSGTWKQVQAKIFETLENKLK